MKAITIPKSVKGLVTQQCLTLCDPMDCSLPVFSIQRILQARMLEWVAVPFSRGSSQPRDRTWVSCIAGRFFTIWASRVDPFLLWREKQTVMQQPTGSQEKSGPNWASVDALTPSLGLKLQREPPGASVTSHCGLDTGQPDSQHTLVVQEGGTGAGFPTLCLSSELFWVLRGPSNIWLKLSSLSYIVF